MNESVSEESIYLELGSIIQIEAPTNTNIHDKIYFIDYLDDNIIRLIDTDTNEDLIINKKNGVLGDESIETINILSIPEHKGFAKQNGLTFGRGISIQFDGEEPVIINGIISNLRDDMIEITTHPDKKILYIDFDYKGIPLDLPIVTIKPFEIPSLEIDEKVTEEQTTDELNNLEMTPEIDFDMEDREITQDVVKARRKEILVDADDIIFGEDLGEVIQVVTVSQNEKRYSIKNQTDDLLDELLAPIPSNQRTNTVINKIHTMIERYEQLRESFSIFNKEGLASAPKKKGFEYKPLVEALFSLDKPLHWIIPVVRNRKKTYNVDPLTVTASDDIIPYNLGEKLDEEDEIFQQYLSGDVPDDQNKYYFLVNRISELETPFLTTNDTNNLIIKKPVNNNFNAIIDNLGDFYSGAIKAFAPEGREKTVKAGVAIRSRFTNTRYITGLKGIYYQDFKKSKLGPEIKMLTKNDKMDIIGFITLPESIFKYSNINLPLTNILRKASLHNINFIMNDFLQENTEVEQQIIEQDKAIPDIDTKTFIKKIKEYSFKQTVDYEDRDEKSYKDYLNKLVPKTDKLFEIIQKYLINDSSYYEIVRQMEPFLVYTNDISFPTYKLILDYMRTKIDIRKKTIVGSVPEFLRYIGQKSFEHPDIILPILSNIQIPTTGEKGRMVVTKEYDIKTVSSCDVLRQILSIDGGKLFNNILSLDMLSLNSSIDIGEQLQDKLSEVNRELSSNESKECSEFVLAKRYLEMDELSADDDNDVYFDKKYDPTRYDILDNFTEFRQMGETVLLNQIIFHLQENVGMKEADALAEAKALIEGKRLVRAGEYALLDRDGDLYYYIRDNNRWRLDDGLRGKEVDEVAFCNLKTKCLSIRNECGDNDENKAKLNKQLVEEILQHFEGQNHIASDTLRVLVESELNESLRVISLLKAIQFYELRKYDMNKVQIALQLDDVERTVSPYQKILDVVLSHSDFVKKQENTIAFVNKYCREAFWSPSADEQEDAYWYYCITTNTKLLPTFLYELAQAYYKDQYSMILDQICADRGTKSDNGDMIVDKYSGFVIRQLEFEQLEGFDAAGRPLTSYDLIQRDKGDILIDIFEMKKDELYKDKNAQIISRVINTLDQSMGISILSEQEFIIRHTIRRLTQELKTQKKYDAQVAKMKKKGKQMAPYKNYVNEFLLYYTLAYYLIALQTTTPGVSAVKTFGTGCKKSFYGYPTEAMGNMESLNYLACVVMNLKSDTDPWNILPSLTRKVRMKIKNKGKEVRVAEEKKIMDNVSKKIQVIIDKKVLKETEVQEKISYKRFYLETSSEKELANIPINIDVQGWSFFLPPLATQQVSNLTPVRPEFTDLLIQEIASGNPNQFDRLNKLYGMMFYYSLAIQEEIQKVVNKVSIILTNKGTTVPYLENACCNEGTFDTYNYFVEGAPLINKYNNIIRNLSALYFGTLEETKSPFIFNPQDTKMKYTVLGNEYSERTIYHSFIYFCHNNTNITITDDLFALCGEIGSTVKSDAFGFKTLYNEVQEFFEKMDGPHPLENRIVLLKRDGFNFTNEAMVNLVNSVNKQRIVNIDLNPIIVSAKHALEGTIKYLKEKENPLLCGEVVLDKLYELIDRFYIEYAEASDEGVVELLAYLQEFNNKTINKLLTNIETTVRLKPTVRDFIKEVFPDRESKGSFKKNKKRQDSFILNWKIRGQGIYMTETDETDYTIVQYLKIIIFNLAKVYPNIIKNKNSFKSKKIPKHWKVGNSEFHTADIQEIIFKEYSSLEQFFGDDELTSILDNVISKSDDLLDLMNATPFFAETAHKTIMSGKILKELTFFYLLCCFNMYMDSLMEVPVELVVDDVRDNDEEEVQDSSLAYSLEAELLEGRRESRNEKLNNLLTVYLDMMLTYKNILNYSNSDIIDSVLRAKEREKNKITTRLGDLTVEEREIENIMKNQRLGNWSLGQTKALFVYDEEQYDRERNEIDKDMLIERELNNNSDVVRENRDMYNFDALEQMDIADRINTEVYALNSVAEDDDMGDDDDQIRLDYGDL